MNLLTYKHLMLRLMSNNQVNKTTVTVNLAVTYI